MRVRLHSAHARRRMWFAVCAVALAALAAILRFWWQDSATAGVLLTALGAFMSVAALMADVLRGDTTARPDGAGPHRRRAVEELAEAVREQWAAEARLRRLQDPAPLEVDWTLADRRLADHPYNIPPGAALPRPRAGGDARGPADPATADPVIADPVIADPATPGPAPAPASAPPGPRVVVLGEPGSGKSVLAMRYVLDRLAARREGGPVPVILPLASWDPLRTPLRDWLAARLAADYRPLAAQADDRRTLARVLVDTGLVAPVLDGFDELPRPARATAVRRINAELDPGAPLLLTSRGDAWAAAVDEGDVLTGAEVVELRPLDLVRAGTHLERSARPLRATADGVPHTVWTPVLRKLAERPDLPLARALTTPLMVALARTVYGDTSRDPAPLLDARRFPTVAAVEEHLLEAFVPAAFADAGPRAAAEATRRLTVLARGLHRRGTGRLAWWELESLVPRTLALYAPGLLALAVLSLLLVPVTLARAADDLVGLEDVLSLVAVLVGQTLGFAFGVRYLLPSGRRGRGGRGGRGEPRARGETDGPDRRFRRRQALITTGVSALVWAGYAYFDDLRFGFRFGGVTDGWMPDLLAGFLFSQLFTLFLGIAGLTRRPTPLGLPWSGAMSRVAARLGGAALAAAGTVTAGVALLGREGNPWTVLLGTTCAVAGTALMASGTSRGGQEGAHTPRAGRIVRRFVTGTVRGTAAAMLIGIASCTAGGFAAVGVTALKSRTAADLRDRKIDGWSFSERAGVRSAATERTLRGGLLLPGDGARPVAYAGAARPPNCTMPLLPRRRCVDFVSRRTVFESRDGDVVARITSGAGPRTTAVHPTNLRSVLPDEGRDWLTQGPATGVLVRDLPPVLVAGLLVGVVGGCVCGVYRALSVPSDLMRAASPGLSLRTDRTASLTRGGMVALLVACVCVPVVATPGDWGGLVHLGTQLWLPLGTAALALSAWGRFLVARSWLAVTGQLPWRLMAFLDEAHQRGVLRQSGAGFEFRHLRLQAQLAAGPTAGVVAARSPGSRGVPDVPDAPDMDEGFDVHHRTP
ncbi:NACHT domain-containing protein [Streptomyces sp. DSM 40484]|uniref:NACHT domain-containing protein n=1 Tax=Streptomyces kroppenstedtii TaxID=3051181 RepID=UPI0028D649A0|nr:NACHT domain-containing protein [Streptomyces sp. DSM 40484]